METIKAFVRPDNTVTIVCPVCKTTKQISAAPYLHKKHSIKIRCVCDAIFTVQFDFRRHYRKQTSLRGTYRIIDSPETGGGIIHIHNISRSGLGFTVSGLHTMQEKQTIQLEFRLNDKNLTRLTKQATIQTVHNNFIGCQFVDQDSLEKALGFYLRR